MCENFNTNFLLRWILILEEYFLYIEYIPGNKNIASDALSQLPNNVNQETTHYSNNTMETIPKFYNIKELSDFTFPIYFKIIYQYQQEEPFLLEKLKCK